jgi:hypothetical protein
MLSKFNIIEPKKNIQEEINDEDDAIEILINMIDMDIGDIRHDYEERKYQYMLDTISETKDKMVHLEKLIKEELGSL